MTTKSTHHGHAIKRFRHTLKMKQDVLGSIMGLSQTQVSTYEQREVINIDMIRRFAKALGVTPELIMELEEDPVTAIIENNMLEAESEDYKHFVKSNLVNRIIELSFEKTILFERLLELEKEMTLFLERIKRERERAE